MALRYLRHLTHGRWAIRRSFPTRVLQAIEAAIGEDEKRHAGQIRFAIEPALEWSELRAGMSVREHAIDVFSHLRVWDTEHNNGVLIYVLLAERDVEIVSDRGIHTRVGQSAWEEICQAMETEFRAGRFEHGAVLGVHRVGELLASHFPPGARPDNELPNRPVLL